MANLFLLRDCPMFRIPCFCPETVPYLGAVPMPMLMNDACLKPLLDLEATSSRRSKAFRE